MNKNLSQNRFIILPSRGIVATANTSIEVKKFLTRLSPKRAAYSVKDVNVKNAKVKVLDALHEDGAKLVEMNHETMAAMKSVTPGIRIVPLVYYKKASVPKASVLKRASKQNRASGTIVRIIANTTGEGIEGCDVIAFTDFENRIGDRGKTNKEGEVTLRIAAGNKLQRLYVYPSKGYWSALKKNIILKPAQDIDLIPLSLDYEDALRCFYKKVKFPKPVKKIRVGVLDTGSGPHDDLIIEGGLNCVLDEDETDYFDNGDGHGTHVAGIIAADGNPPKGVRGIAPGVILRSYRVFGKNADGASNYDIIKAIDKAVEDKCDILNMSLGGGLVDPAVQEAISDAFDNGTICFVATGNDDRQPVSFPASYSLSIAISAVGRKGTFPQGTIHTESIEKPFSKKDDQSFIASFSNIGPEVDFTAPGVAIISTVPGGYAAMDGTSMACPAAVGAAARFLSAHPSLLDMTRNQNRSVSMVKYLVKKAQLLEFWSRIRRQRHDILTCT